MKKSRALEICQTRFRALGLARFFVHAVLAAATFLATAVSVEAVAQTAPPLPNVPSTTMPASSVEASAEPGAGPALTTESDTGPALPTESGGTGSAPPASAPAVVLAPQLLHLTYPATSTLKRPVDVQFALADGILKVHFEVRGQEIFAKEHLGPGEYPYQYDVVEIFVSVAGQKAPFPYYEFEVSPYGETFNVKIPGGGKPFQDGIDVGSVARAQRVKGNWSADLEIPLAHIGYDGDPKKIVGNAFAVLGRKPLRSYWSLSLPIQAKPNFHKPEFFRPFFPGLSPSPPRN